jgi:hypothetical protein
MQNGAYCKTCASAAQRRYWQKNREEILSKSRANYAANKETLAARQRKYMAKDPTRKRRYRVKEKFGLEWTDYQRMVVEQDGICACCGDNDKPLVVDHCHESGRVRALLCNWCNSALGHAKEDIERLKHMIRYLEVHQTNAGGIL